MRRDVGQYVMTCGWRRESGQAGRCTSTFSRFTTVAWSSREGRPGSGETKTHAGSTPATARARTAPAVAAASKRALRGVAVSVPEIGTLGQAALVPRPCEGRQVGAAAELHGVVEHHAVPGLLDGRRLVLAVKIGHRRRALQAVGRAAAEQRSHVGMTSHTLEQ